MSARRILGRKYVPRVGLFAHQMGGDFFDELRPCRHEAFKILEWPYLWRTRQKAIRAGSSGQSKAQRHKRKEQYDLLKPRLGEGQVDAALA